MKLLHEFLSKEVDDLEYKSKQLIKLSDKDSIINELKASIVRNSSSANTPCEGINCKIICERMKNGINSQRKTVMK